MCSATLDSSRLYALIGESARLLPDIAFASLELMLGSEERLQQKLDAVSVAPPSNVANVPAASAHDALAWQEREALGTILEILHSAQQERGEGFGGSLDDRLVEGLIIAGRLIVDLRERERTC